MPRAIISAVASHTPERVLTNDELAARPGGYSADQIFEKTGIRERRIAADDECASDLAVAAAEKLFASGRATPDEVDYLLFCTQSPDYFLPATACVIQDRLGLPRSCGAIDFNQGCSGFVVGLSLAKGLIASGQARCVLLLTGDTYSKFIHPGDRSVCTVFGDGAAATVVRAHEGPGGLGEFVFGTDGRGARQLMVPAGGLRQPRSEETAIAEEDSDGNVRSRDNLYMNGREIFRFAITAAPKSIRALLAKQEWSTDELDHMVLHQANRFMLDELVKRLKTAPEKVPYEFEDRGNTVSSTIPIVLERLIEGGRLRPGAKLLLCGFGVGYSWAGCTVEWV